jgi:hypothetical protein
MTHACQDMSAAQNYDSHLIHTVVMTISQITLQFVKLQV